MKLNGTENPGHSGGAWGSGSHALYICNLPKGLQGAERDSPQKESMYYLVSLSPCFHKSTLSPFCLVLFEKKYYGHINHRRV